LSVAAARGKIGGWLPFSYRGAPDLFQAAPVRRCAGAPACSVGREKQPRPKQKRRREPGAVRDHRNAAKLLLP